MQLWWCGWWLERSPYSSISERNVRCGWSCCDWVFQTTESLTDLCCQYSILILKYPGRCLASIFQCHKNDCKWSVLWYWRRTECSFDSSIWQSNTFCFQAFAIVFSGLRGTIRYVLPLFRYYFNIAKKWFWQAESVATRGISDFCCHISDSNERNRRAAIAATNIHLCPNMVSLQIDLSMQGSNLASQAGTLFVYYMTWAYGNREVEFEILSLWMPNR